MKNPVLLYEVSFFSALWMVFPESWKRSCPNFYAHDCNLLYLDFTGSLNEDYLRELLTTLGDRFTQEEVDDLYKEAPIKDGQFDFVEFTRILKHGAKDPDDK